VLISSLFFLCRSDKPEHQCEDEKARFVKKISSITWLIPKACINRLSYAKLLAFSCFRSVEQIKRDPLPFLCTKTDFVRQPCQIRPLRRNPRCLGPSRCGRRRSVRGLDPAFLKPVNRATPISLPNRHATFSARLLVLMASPPRLSAQDIT